MSTSETKTTTCDACGKSVEVEERHNGEYRPGGPRDPWLVIRVSGHWMTEYGDAARTQFDACSPACAIKVIEKATEKLKRLTERFPTVVGS